MYIRPNFFWYVIRVFDWEFNSKKLKISEPLRNPNTCNYFQPELDPGENLRVRGKKLKAYEDGRQTSSMVVANLKKRQ